MLITTEPQTGSFREVFMENGNYQLPPRFSGSMENVRPPFPRRSGHHLTASFLYSWLGKDRTLVRGLFTLSVKNN